MIVIIGAGAAGASTAFALARRGADVGIVEAGLTGAATAAGAGIVEPWSAPETGPFSDLYAASADYYPTLVERLRESGVADIGYRRNGSMVVDAEPAALDAVEKRVRQRIPTGVSRLDPAQARSLFPPLARDLAALYIEGGARVDGRALRAGLLAAAERLGARTIGQHAQLRPGAPRGWRLSVDGAEVDADAVVVAAGAWTNRVLEPLGERVPVEPQRGQIVHVRLEGVDTGGWPTVLPISDHYLVPFDDGRIAAGATREAGSGFDPRVTAAGQKHVLDRALALAPGLADATFVETRVGLRPLSDEALPVAGFLSEELSGLAVNTGFGPAGLTLGPLVGERLAGELLRESPTAS